MKKTLGSVALIAILAGIWFGWQAWNRRGLVPRAPGLAGAIQVEMVPIKIWFPSREGMELVEEASSVPKTDDAGLRLKNLIETLHRGPANSSALHLFPENSAPRAVFLSADGTAYLDYPKSIFERPMGLREEFLFVRTLGKNLLRNCPEVKSFVLLIDGAPCDFISRHMPAHGKYILPASRPAK